MLIDELMQELNCKNPSIIDCKKLGHEIKFIWETYYSKVGEKSWKKTFDFLLDNKLPTTIKNYISLRKMPIDIQMEYECYFE